jgi:integrase
VLDQLWELLAVGEALHRVTAGRRRRSRAGAVRAGANPKVVQRMLGHASAAMTLDVYADLFECDLDEVAVTVPRLCPQWADSQ